MTSTCQHADAGAIDIDDARLMSRQVRDDELFTLRASRLRIRACRSHAIVWPGRANTMPPRLSPQQRKVILPIDIRRALDIIGGAIRERLIYGHYAMLCACDDIRWPYEPCQLLAGLVATIGGMQP